VDFHCSSISMLMDNCYLRFGECSSKTALVKPGTTVIDEHTKAGNMKAHLRQVHLIWVFVDNCCGRFDKFYFRIALVKPSTTVINEHTKAGNMKANLRQVGHRLQPLIGCRRIWITIVPHWRLLHSTALLRPLEAPFLRVLIRL